MGTKRIDLSLFDDNLKALINASAKIFPMSLSDVQANLNPNLYEYARIIDTGPRKNEIYIWTNSVFELIGADDKTVLWTDVQSKPLSYPNDLAHTHSNMTLINTITQVMFDTWTTAVTHISDVVKHITGVERTAWNGKAEGIHTHVKASITDFPVIPTDTNQLTKTDVYTKIEVTTSLALKSDAIHDHDGRYNTKAEITSALGGKSDTTHDHSLVYAVKSTEGVASANSGLITGLRTDVNTNTNSISTIQTNMANGDMHSNIGILNQLTQILLDNWNGAVTHISDAVKHITGAERTAWNAKSNFSGVYTDLTSKPTIPVVTGINSGTNTGDQDITGKADKTYVDIQDATKVDSTTFTGHTGNTTIHVLQTDKDGWSAKVGTLDSRLTDARPANGGVSAGIMYLDSRGSDFTGFNYIGITNHLKGNTTDGLNDGGTFHGIVHITHWLDSSGGASHQLGFTDNGNMWFRYWNGASWSSWSQLNNKSQIVQGITEPVSTAYWFKEV